MGRWISAKLSNSLMNIKVNTQWKIKVSASDKIKLS